MQQTHKKLGQKSQFAIVCAVVVVGILGYMGYMIGSGTQGTQTIDETQRAGRFVSACGHLDQNAGIPECVSYYNDTLNVVYADKSGKWPFVGGPNQADYEATYRQLADRTKAYNDRVSDPSRKLDLHPYR